MTDEEIANMLAAYHKECDAAETLREKGDVQLKHARLIREALCKTHVVKSGCVHPITYATYTKSCPRKCLLCGNFIDQIGAHCR